MTDLLQLSESTAPVAVFLCDRTGNAAEPWAAAGFECYCIDIQHSIRKDRREGNICFMWGDVRSWMPPTEIRGRIVFGAAFPPCTDVAVSGARDFLKKGLHRLTDALELFTACERAFAWAGIPYMIENPVGVISTHYRGPDFTFDPWQYGDPWTKKTCLWTGNGFVMPPATVKQKPEKLLCMTYNWDSIARHLGEKPDDKNKGSSRSVTPPGFARAVFEANAPQLLARVA